MRPTLCIAPGRHPLPVITDVERWEGAGILSQDLEYVILTLPQRSTRIIQHPRANSAEPPCVSSCTQTLPKSDLMGVRCRADYRKFTEYKKYPQRVLGALTALLPDARLLRHYRDSSALAIAGSRFPFLSTAFPVSSTKLDLSPHHYSHP